jgi:hypothetical protein
MTRVKEKSRPGRFVDDIVNHGLPEKCSVSSPSDSTAIVGISLQLYAAEMILEVK